jgi:hypothetical protein
LVVDWSGEPPAGCREPPSVSEPPEVVLGPRPEAAALGWRAEADGLCVGTGVGSVGIVSSARAANGRKAMREVTSKRFNM